MARQSLPINLSAMQTIIDVEERSYNGGLIAFYDHCCKIYNEKEHPAKPLYGQIVYNHVKKNNLRSNFGKARRISSDDVEEENDFCNEKYQHLFDIVDEVNKERGTDYRLEIHGGFAQVARTGWSGPCLSLRNMEPLLLGLKLWKGVA